MLSKSHFKLLFAFERQGGSIIELICLKVYNNKLISQRVIKFVYLQAHFHGAPEEFFDTISPELVPQEYGGRGPSLKTLHGKTSSC